jgi:hypothetical protein
VAVEPLPADVSFITVGWASTATGEMEAPEQRPVEPGDVRTKCDYCPAYVDGNAASGQAWLQTHVMRAHGGSL